MADNATIHLDVPYLIADRFHERFVAQRRQTGSFNDALDALDTVIQLSVQSRVTTTPPSTPAEGDVYSVPVSATGVWQGHATAIAFYRRRAWHFLTPVSGWLMTVQDEAMAPYVFDGADWVLLFVDEDSAPAWGTITGTLSDQTDLQAALDALGGGGGAWGSITGTLSDQTDLQAALDAKGAGTVTGTGTTDLLTMWDDEGSGLVDSVIGTTVLGGATEGSVLFIGTGGIIQEETVHLVWNDTEKQLLLFHPRVLGGPGAGTSGLFIGSTDALGYSARLSLASNNELTGPPKIETLTYNGTFEAPTPAIEGDFLFLVDCFAWGSTDQAVYLRGVVDGVPSGSIVPGRLGIATQNSTGDLQERFRITSVGTTGITTPDAGSALVTAGQFELQAGPLAFKGTTSGLVKVQPATVAGTWTLTLPIDDGLSGQSLITNGAGVTSWSTVVGIAGNPAGSDNQIQLNESSAFAADGDLTYNPTTHLLYLGGSQKAWIEQDITENISAASLFQNGLLHFQEINMTMTANNTSAEVVGYYQDLNFSGTGNLGGTVALSANVFWSATGNNSFIDGLDVNLNLSAAATATNMTGVLVGMAGAGSVGTTVKGVEVAGLLDGTNVYGVFIGDYTGQGSSVSESLHVHGAGKTYLGGPVVLAGLPTSDPHVAGQLYAPGTTVLVSVG